MMTALGYHNGFVLLGSSHQLLTATFRETFHQNIELLSLILFILQGRDFCLQGYQFVQSANLLFLGDIIGKMLRSIGSRTL